MILKDINNLLIINTDSIEDKYSVSALKTILIKPNYLIYFITSNKVYGVVSIEDLSNAMDHNDEEVIINQDYLCINEFNLIKAKEIYSNDNSINELPIIIDGVLKGAYVKGINHECVMEIYKSNSKLFEQCLNLGFLYSSSEIYSNNSNYKICYVNTSNLLDNEFMNFLKAFFNKCNCSFRTISYEEFLNNEFINDEFMLFDNDYYLCNYRFIAKILLKPYSLLSYFSFSSLYRYINNIYVDEITSKYLSSFFKELENRGINVYNVVFPQEDIVKKYLSQINDNYEKHGMHVNASIVEPKEFFQDLYSDEYHNEIMKQIYKDNQKNIAGINYVMDISSKYLNVKDGIRKTLYQFDNPTSYIHMYGACICFGPYVEDKNTIESFFQKRLAKDGVKYNVINHGSWNNDLEFMNMICNTKLYKGDTVVYYRLSNNINGIKNINMTEVLAENDLNINYFVDTFYHVNHIINELYANKLYDEIVPSIKLDNDRHSVTSSLAPSILVYLDRYFNSIDLSKYNNIGSIVMNCNPFTKGHLYLIEEAAKKVDYLIIFVVSEDLSTFSFEERFSMVLANTKHLSNVLVVPSGHMILSQRCFPEYFKKEIDSDIDSNIRNDLEIFAKVIAPRLNIKYRFVGEELSDQVTEKYNILMKEILPENGIELIELPRKEVDNKIISASLVRELISNNNLDELDKYIPSKTKDIILKN